MNMTMQDVLAVLGAKELELVSLRNEVAKLQEEQKKAASEEKKDVQ